MNGRLFVPSCSHVSPEKDCDAFHCAMVRRQSSVWRVCSDRHKAVQRLGRRYRPAAAVSQQQQEQQRQPVVPPVAALKTAIAAGLKSTRLLELTAPRLVTRMPLMLSTHANHPNSRTQDAAMLSMMRQLNMSTVRMSSQEMVSAVAAN